MSLEPAVYAGQPDNLEDYTAADYQGLKVFITKKASFDQDGVKISLVGRGPWQRLIVDGLTA